MTALFSAVAGTLVAPVGQLWAAFSPLSGETTMLNDESAAILEVLADGPLDLAAVCEALATDTGQPASELWPIVDGCWPPLMEAGLIRKMVVQPAACPEAGR